MTLPHIFYVLYTWFSRYTKGIHSKQQLKKSWIDFGGNLLIICGRSNSELKRCGGKGVPWCCQRGLPHALPDEIGKQIFLINTYSAKGPWNKTLNFIFPTKYGIPKSFKVGHWLSQNRLHNLLLCVVWKFGNLGFFTKSSDNHPFGGSQNFKPTTLRNLMIKLTPWLKWTTSVYVIVKTSKLKAKND